MSDYSNIKVGDTVWYSDINRNGLFEVVVTKVGSKLVTTSPLGRICPTTVFRKDTGRTNDEFSHQTLILDKVAYEAWQAAAKLIYKLRDAMRQGRPNPGVTADDIRAAAALLKIDLEQL